MNKSTHFIGQPMYGQLLNLLDKQKILRISWKKRSKPSHGDAKKSPR